MSEETTTRVEILGRAFVVVAHSGKAANLIGYLTPEEIMKLQKLAATGMTWEQFQQRFAP